MYLFIYLMVMPLGDDSGGGGQKQCKIGEKIACPRATIIYDIGGKVIVKVAKK